MFTGDVQLLAVILGWVGSKLFACLALSSEQLAVIHLVCSNFLKIAQVLCYIIMSAVGLACNGSVSTILTSSGTSHMCVCVSCQLVRIDH